MNINDFKYVSVGELTGDIIADARKLLVLNGKSKTLEHVAAVADTNRYIANKFGLDEYKCISSAYLHDISAVISPKDMLNYIMENNLFLDEAELKHPFLLHQRISRFIAKEHFHIEDEDILAAIECHTTMKSEPSKYDMALFIADKLSWDQEGRPPFYEVVREGLDISLEKACFRYINYIMENNMILHPHSWLLQGKEFLERVLSGQR